MKRAVPSDWLVRFQCKRSCGQGDYDRDQITVLVKGIFAYNNIAAFEQACNRIRIVAHSKGWNELSAFEDMTVDIDS